MNYLIKQVATCGCEIRNKENQVVAWSVDRVWAEKIKIALEKSEREEK